MSSITERQAFKKYCWRTGNSKKFQEAPVRQYIEYKNSTGSKKTWTGFEFAPLLYSPRQINLWLISILWDGDENTLPHYIASHYEG